MKRISPHILILTLILPGCTQPNEVPQPQKELPPANKENGTIPIGTPGLRDLYPKKDKIIDPDNIKKYEQALSNARAKLKAGPKSENYYSTLLHIAITESNYRTYSGNREPWTCTVDSCWEVLHAKRATATNKFVAIKLLGRYYIDYNLFPVEVRLAKRIVSEFDKHARDPDGLVLRAKYLSVYDPEAARVEFKKYLGSKNRSAAFNAKKFLRQLDEQTN